MTTKQYLKGLSDKELIKEILELYHNLYTTECFGKRGIMLYHYAVSELEGRGYEVGEEKRMLIEKLKSKGGKRK